MGKSNMKPLFDMVFTILPLFIVSVILIVIYDKSLLTGDWNIIAVNYTNIVPLIIGFALGMYYLIKGR